MFPLPYRWVTQMNFISANSCYSGKTLHFRCRCGVKGGEKFLLSPRGVICLQLKIMLMLTWHIGGGGEGSCPTPLHSYLWRSLSSRAGPSLYVLFRQLWGASKFLPGSFGLVCFQVKIIFHAIVACLAEGRPWPLRPSDDTF